MSRPERPKDKSATYNLFAEHAWAYMDAIEEERDEAVQLLGEILIDYRGLTLATVDPRRRAEAFLSRMGRTDA